MIKLKDIISEVDFAHSKGGQIEVGNDYIYTLGKRKRRIKIKDIHPKKGVRYYDFSSREYITIPVSTWNNTKAGHYMTPIKELKEDCGCETSNIKEQQVQLVNRTNDGNFVINIREEDLNEEERKLYEFGQKMEVLLEKNCPTDASKWSYWKGQAKKKFDVYPSAYANGWASKKYKEAGGSWKKCE